ncbi:MAG: polysaccharide pyruvyl transferase CsaB [Betaproteobacteria bacterium]
MARVVVSGYYGFGNAGDEAVLAAIAQALRRHDPGGEIVVVSADPEETERVHGVKAISRANLGAVQGALSRADLLLSGGGSLLQDITSLRSLVYYLGVMALAQWRGVPVFFYAQGVGPLRRPLARWLVRRVAQGVAGITVRDEASAELLRQIGVRRPPIHVTADPVFAFVPDGVGMEAATAAPEGEKPVFGFAFRPWRGEETWQPAVAQAAGELARRYGAEIRWLSFHPDRDLAVSRALQAECPAPSVVVEPGQTPAEVFAQVAQCHLVVAARLHALIIGAVAGRPVVGVSYDPKVEALVAQLGQAPAGRLPGITAEELATAAAKAWEGREEAVARLAPRVAVLRERAEQTAELALACARQPQPPVDPVRATAPRAQENRVSVLGIRVDPVTLPEAVQRIGEWIRGARPDGAGRTRQVVTLNPEMVMAARRHPELAAIIGEADLVTADGVGVVWAARRLGRHLPGRVTGIDLVEGLLAVGAEAGWRFYFLGAAPGVAEEAARRAAERHQGLRVVGTHHGYFPADEAERVARAVAAAEPDILLVALGSPAQEEFIARGREYLGAGVAIGVGGTLDVLAERTRRAPGWLRRLGLEWLYRIVGNPRRWRRALVLPAFVLAVLRQPRG